MKYKWTFHLVSGERLSINSEVRPELDSEWLTLTDKDYPENSQIVNMRKVVFIEKEPIK